TGGSGLGLAIVQALVEAHHGTVGVDTSPGRGATFRVRLPRARD
ncbi:ATP-binding protein, partial [Dietzia sp. NCCP-2495]